VKELSGHSLTLATRRRGRTLPLGEHVTVVVVVGQCSEEIGQFDVVLAGDDVGVVTGVDDPTFQVEDGDPRSVSRDCPDRIASSRTIPVTDDSWSLSGKNARPTRPSLPVRCVARGRDVETESSQRTGDDHDQSHDAAGVPAEPGELENEDWRCCSKEHHEGDLETSPEPEPCVGYVAHGDPLFRGVD
jgi:hypothetical protein